MRVPCTRQWPFGTSVEVVTWKRELLRRSHTLRSHIPSDPLEFAASATRQIQTPGAVLPSHPRHQTDQLDSCCVAPSDLVRAPHIFVRFERITLREDDR